MELYNGSVWLGRDTHGKWYGYVSSAVSASRSRTVISFAQAKVLCARTYKSLRNLFGYCMGAPTPILDHVSWKLPLVGRSHLRTGERCLARKTQDSLHFARAFSFASSRKHFTRASSRKSQLAGGTPQLLEAFQCVLELHAEGTTWHHTRKNNNALLGLCKPCLMSTHALTIDGEPEEWRTPCFVSTGRAEEHKVDCAHDLRAESKQEELGSLSS